MADYSLDCTESYKLGARTIFNTSWAATLRRYARSMGKKQHGLPLFVPDWSVQRRRLVSWMGQLKTDTHARSERGREAELNSTATELRVRGLVLGRVANTTRRHVIFGNGLVVRMYKINTWVSDFEATARSLLDSCPDEDTRSRARSHTMDIVLKISVSPLYEAADAVYAKALKCYHIVRMDICIP